MPPDADAVAQCVLATYEQLPDKRKPQPRPGGAREWVPLAGIVLSKVKTENCHAYPWGLGNVLHDWHAEILAIRAFNRYLLDQCLYLSTLPYHTSQFIRSRTIEERTELEFHPFTVKEDVQIYMYCSEAPCGDASMELVMDAQEDATPWTTSPPTVSTSFAQSESTEAPDEAGPLASAVRGRSHFSLLGAVRCKPSRPDAPPTLSKSCTDKLALKQATSLLLSTTSLIMSPQNAYIHSLVLPESQLVPAACERAFSRSGRMRHVAEEVEKHGVGGHRWQGFEVRSTKNEFTWSRRGVGPGKKAVPSNISAVWTPDWQETVIGGVQQGRKQFDSRGASAICRRSMWKMAIQVAAAVGIPALAEALGQRSYKEVKNIQFLEPRRNIKLRARRESLNGWVKNTGDDEFSLDVMAKA